MKTCTKCKKSKPLADFQPEPRYETGVRSRCRECFNLANALYRSQHPELVTERKRRYRTRNRKAIRDNERLYRSNHPERGRAKTNLYCAVKSGKLSRRPCEICGGLDVHGHHFDYDRQLDVVWLYRSHHMKLHGGHKETLHKVRGIVHERYGQIGTRN